MRSIHRRCSFIYCLALLPATLLTGCQELTQLIEARSEQEPEPPSDVELQERLAKSISDAEQAIEMFEMAGGSMRLQRFSDAFDEGMELAEQLVETAEPETDAHSAACQAKALLLRRKATFRSDTEAAKLLRDFAQQIEKQFPESDVSEQVEAQWLAWKFIDNNRPFQSAFAALNEFHTQHPHSDRTAELFIEYCEELYQSGALDKSKRCYLAAKKIRPDDPSLAELGQKLKNQFKARAGKLAEARRSAAQVARFASQHLGGRQRGYFVIFAKKGKGGYMSPCSYCVAHNADEVAEFAENMQLKGWSWEIKATFSDTKAGKKKATAERTRLEDKNTIKMPVFQSF